MKCENCGGEVDSQAISCPYCGGRNEAGINFYKEVYQKVNRNKLLAPLLLRQKTPELIQRMLTRIIVAMGIMGVVFIGISVVMILMTDDPIFSDAQPEPGSYAAEYTGIWDDYDYRNWAEYSSELLEVWNGGSPKRSLSIGQMLGSGFDLYYGRNKDPQLQEQARLEVDALLEGVLQLSREELAPFHRAGEQGGSYVYLDTETREKLEEVIEAKLAARLEDMEQ
ncbi:MAG: zinc ribbon domain-containing protein [Acetatifactor sp.]|nr:zinc ribbon domain-containing protein [Acetatifactor sp.]